jgi:hypothetical protein
LYACRHDKPPSVTVQVVFIGGLAGEQHKWVTQTVEKIKSLVQLKKVQNSSAKPSFSFTPNWHKRNMGVKALNKRSLTLQKVRGKFDNPVILVLTSNLSLPASSVICLQSKDDEGYLRSKVRAKAKNK